MRMRTKTVMDQMNAEKPDDLLAELGAKQLEPPNIGSPAPDPRYSELVEFWRGHARVLRECANENTEEGYCLLGEAKVYEMCAWQLEYLRNT